MRVSDLQSKDIITVKGKNIGRIVDIDIIESGTINYFLVEEKKFMKKFSFNGSETKVKLNEIVNIGEDVILVDLK